MATPEHHGKRPITVWEAQNVDQNTNSFSLSSPLLLGTAPQECAEIFTPSAARNGQEAWVFWKKSSLPDNSLLCTPVCYMKIGVYVRNHHRRLRRALDIVWFYSLDSNELHRTAPSYLNNAIFSTFIYYWLYKFSHLFKADFFNKEMFPKNSSLIFFTRIKLIPLYRWPQL